MYNLPSPCVPLYLTSRDSTIVVGGILAPQCEHTAELSTSSLSSPRKGGGTGAKSCNLNLILLTDYRTGNVGLHLSGISTSVPHRLSKDTSRAGWFRPWVWDTDERWYKPWTPTAQVPRKKYNKKNENEMHVSCKPLAHLLNNYLPLHPQLLYVLVSFRTQAEEKGL